MNHNNIVTELASAFAKHSDKKIAAWQEAYMKHRYRFFGIQKPKRVLIQKPLFNAHSALTISELNSIISQLWDHENRECQYAAVDFLRRNNHLWNENTLSLIHTCITHKSWWDTVDDLAGCVGELCIQFSDHLDTMDQWITDSNMWLRRVAILFQLKYKTTTDVPRLFDYCLKTIHEKEFFIRKAIGWALREYSKTDQKAVAHFVNEYRNQLSSLSAKEASKYL